LLEEESGLTGPGRSPGRPRRASAKLSTSALRASVKTAGMQGPEIWFIDVPTLSGRSLAQDTVSHITLADMIRAPKKRLIQVFDMGFAASRRRRNTFNLVAHYREGIRRSVKEISVLMRIELRGQSGELCLRTRPSSWRYLYVLYLPGARIGSVARQQSVPSTTIDHRADVLITTIYAMSARHSRNRDPDI
jgi:hypothetical protein